MTKFPAHLLKTVNQRREPEIIEVFPALETEQRQQGTRFFFPMHQKTTKAGIGKVMPDDITLHKWIGFPVSQQQLGSVPGQHIPLVVAKVNWGWFECGEQLEADSPSRQRSFRGKNYRYRSNAGPAMLSPKKRVESNHGKAHLWYHTREHRPLDPLSERELDVLREIARGSSNQGIADLLVISVETVKRHVSNILSKLGAANRTQAVALARRLGLLSDEAQYQHA